MNNAIINTSIVYAITFSSKCIEVILVNILSGDSEDDLIMNLIHSEYYTEYNIYHYVKAVKYNNYIKPIHLLDKGKILSKIEKFKILK